jgi:hypothetical protein
MGSILILKENMEGKDFKNKLFKLIESEVRDVLAEGSGRYGSLTDPKSFDPVDPEVHITGYGVLLRSQLRNEIAARLSTMAKTAKDAAGSDVSYNQYKALASLIGEKGVLTRFILAELDVADELEEMRTKGGRRTTPIPKQK